MSLDNVTRGRADGFTEFGLNVKVITLRHGPFWNFTYLAGMAGGDAVVIDPAWDAAAILAAAGAGEMRIAAIALTHAHHDHVNAVEAIVAATGAGVFLHGEEAPLLAHEYAGMAAGLADGEAVPIRDFEMRLLHTPGHTHGSACFVIEGRLFTGDTLMTGGAGRHGHWPGARQLLDESLARLAALPRKLIVHPGHDEGPVAAIGLGEALRAGRPS